MCQVNDSCYQVCNNAVFYLSNCVFILVLTIMPSTNDDENIFKILISTDNHLGYKEKDPEIGKHAL